MKNPSSSASSRSSSRSSPMIHFRSGALYSRHLCSLPSTNLSTWVEHAMVFSAGYCATAPVFNRGNSLIVCLQFGHDVVQRMRVKQRFLHCPGNLRAVIKERTAVYGLHLNSDWLACHTRRTAGAPWQTVLPVPDWLYTKRCQPGR